MYTIRNATIPDIPLIRELVFQVWPQTYRGLLSDAQIEYMLEMMYSETSLREQIEQGSRFIIIEEGGVPVGYAAFQEMEPSIFKLHKIYVLPSQQGKGTGRYMIDFITREISKEDATALQLQVNKKNRARYFYEKLGFRILREFKVDIGNGYFMDDYLMELTLPSKSRSTKR